MINPKNLIFILSFTLLGCSTENKSEDLVIEQNIPDSDPIPIITDEDPFNISLAIVKENEEDFYSLTTVLNLDSGSYIISHHSTDDIFLQFNILFEENEHIIEEDSIYEDPLSIVQYEEIIDQEVRYVKENTTFKKMFQKINQDDFEVKGSIEFLVEPSCSVEKIKFTLKHASNIFSIESEKFIPNQLEI